MGAWHQDDTYQQDPSGDEQIQPMNRRHGAAIALTFGAWSIAFLAGWLVGKEGSVIGFDDSGSLIRDSGPTAFGNWFFFVSVCAIVSASGVPIPTRWRGSWLLFVSITGAFGACLAGVGLPPITPWIDWGPVHGGDFGGLSSIIFFVGLATIALANVQLVILTRRISRDSVRGSR